MAPLLFSMGSLSLGETRRFTFEVGLYAISTIDLFDAVTKILGIGYDYMTLCFGFFGSGLGAGGTLFVTLITNLTGGLSKLSFHPVSGPFGVLTVSG